MMKLTLTAMTVLGMLALFSCRQKEEAPQSQQQSAPQQQAQPQEQAGAGVSVHTAVVQEVLQASAYTYLNVKENDSNFWIAVTKREIQPGATISFAEGLEMNNFQSKDLQRTFEKVYFVDQVAGDAPPSASAGQSSMGASHRMKPEMDKQAVSVEPAPGGITIAELFAKKDSYSARTVLIKGQVTKINRAIMGKNWVHLQDGTSDSGNYDLTITTSEDASVGDVVTFEGTITLNKDFGAGYSYQVIMEDAKKKAQ